MHRTMKRAVGTFLLAGAALCGALPCAAMNHNLLWAWSNPPRCSPPQTPLFAFWNKANEDFMFRTGGDKIEIWCQAAVRAGSGLSWSLHHNQLKKPFLTGMAEARPSNLFRIEIPTVGLKPGFYDVRVRLEGTGFDRIALLHNARILHIRDVSALGRDGQDVRGNPWPWTRLVGGIRPRRLPLAG